MKLYVCKGTKVPAVINLERVDAYECVVYESGKGEWLLRIDGKHTPLTYEDCRALIPLIGMNLLDIADPYTEKET